MKRYILLTFLNWIVFTIVVEGQYDPFFGQYVFNSTIINPAQAGVFEENQAAFLHRNQWVRFEGAPITTTVFANFKLARFLGGAVGIYQDKIGPITETKIQIDISYSLRIEHSWALSAGIRVKGTNTSTNFDDLRNIEYGDPNLNGNLISGFAGNLGFGALLYSKEAFIGVAIPQAMTRTMDIGLPIYSVLPKSMFAYGGITFPLADGWEFMSSCMLRKGIGNPAQLDLHAIFKYQDKYDFGPMIRLSNSIGLLTGYRISEKWYLGYQFEFPINAIQQGSLHTHELALRFYWKSKFRPFIRSPRYFM